MYENRVALLFSGGRDSLLCALRLEEVEELHLITCDNCHIEGINHICYTIDNIKDIRYAKTTIHAVLHIQAKFHKYLKPFMESYGCVCPMLHCTCFACRLAMIVNTIQYCKKYKINMIATGDRQSDPYLLSTKSIQKLFKKLCSDNNIKYVTPVYDIVSDYDRNIEISEKGVIPKTYECKCWLGYEPTIDILHSDIKYVKEFYLNEVYPLILSDLKKEDVCHEN